MGNNNRFFCDLCICWCAFDKIEGDLMRKFQKFLKSENGAAQMIEAAIIYPIVFFCLVFLIYMGLYILQYMSVSAYAQKVALLASREIAYPGYINMIDKDGKKYNNAALEADLSNYGNSFNGNISISFDPNEVESRAYRYWSKDPLSGYEEPFENILTEMVLKNSIIGSKNEVTAEITSENYFVVQYVNVKISQPLMNFAILDYFGIESPTVAVSIKASANDTDEFIRNTDFAVDAIEAIAKKLGIDVDSMKSKVKEAKEKLGLN